MPPFEMGKLHRKGIGSPYAARNYTAVDPEYGTMDELKTLIKRARQLGFRFILGMMPNHTSRDHVWIESHPEYYVQDEHGQIIYDLDWSDTAKLNYTDPGLRQAMFDVYDFWLSLLGNGDGVDGFRIDMAHFINDLSFWDETIAPLCQKYSDRDLLFLAECYGIDNSLDLFRRGFNASYDDAFYKLLEHYYGTDRENNTVLFTPNFHAENTHHSPQFGVFQQEGYAGAVKALLAEYETCLPAIDHPVYFARYIDNHDEGRSIYRFGEGAVRAMTALTYLSNHCMPFLLTGQEFGAANRPPIHNRFGLCDKGRNETDGSSIYRKEGIEFEGNSFVRGFEQRRQLLAFYRDLIALRAAHPCLQYGQLEWVELQQNAPAAEHTVIAFKRSLPNQTLFCAVNLGHTARTLDTPLPGGKMLYGERTENATLAAFSTVVIEV
jgi:glycosidase